MERTQPTLAFIPAHLYARLLDVLGELGHDTAELLRGAGIGPEAIATEGGFLTLAQVEALVGEAVRREPEAVLALRTGSRMTLMSHGWLSVAALSATTAANALALVAEYFPLICPLFSVELAAEEDATIVRLLPEWSLSEAVERFHIAMFFASLHAHVPKLLFRGALPSGLRVSLAVPRPDDLPPWIEQIGAAIHFDQPRHELAVPTCLTEARLPLADGKVHRTAVQRCRAELEARPNPTELATAVRSVLLECGPPFVDLVGTARRLAVSGRSLRRRLRAEGTSFRTLLDEVRSTIADQWLEDPTRSITEIGLDLGYTDAANFARAYRRANGQSPSAARKQRLGVCTS